MVGRPETVSAPTMLQPARPGLDAGSDWPSAEVGARATRAAARWAVATRDRIVMSTTSFGSPAWRGEEPRRRRLDLDGTLYRPTTPCVKASLGSAALRGSLVWHHRLMSGPPAVRGVPEVPRPTWPRTPRPTRPTRG